MGYGYKSSVSCTDPHTSSIQVASGWSDGSVRVHKSVGVQIAHLRLHTLAVTSESLGRSERRSLQINIPICILLSHTLIHPSGVAFYIHHDRWLGRPILASTSLDGFVKSTDIKQAQEQYLIDGNLCHARADEGAEDGAVAAASQQGSDGRRDSGSREAAEPPEKNDSRIPLQPHIGSEVTALCAGK